MRVKNCSWRERRGNAGTREKGGRIAGERAEQSRAEQSRAERVQGSKIEGEDGWNKTRTENDAPETAYISFDSIMFLEC